MARIIIVSDYLEIKRSIKSILEECLKLFLENIKSLIITDIFLTGKTGKGSTFSFIIPILRSGV